MDKWRHIFGNEGEYAAPEMILAEETDPGITMADNLVGLAIHNAYHFGKIVAIRQMMGVWLAKIK